MKNFDRRLMALMLLLALFGGAVAGVVAAVALDASLEEYAARLLNGRPPGTPGNGDDRTTTEDDNAAVKVRAVGDVSVAMLSRTTLDSRLAGSWIDDHEALGYGVVVSADGWVLVHDAALVSVGNVLREVEVWIEGVRYEPTQYVDDLLAAGGMIKIDASGLSPVAFSASEDVVAGSPVYLAGSREGLVATTVIDTRFTPGSRVAAAEAYVYGWQLGSTPEQTMPMFAGNGNLLGLAGEGNVVPIHESASFVKEVIRSGSGAEAGLGAYVIDLYSVLNIDPALAQGLEHGALITAPAPGVAAIVRSSPASTAGLLVGDIITSVDGVRVDHNHTLAELLSLYDPGETAGFTIRRASNEMTLTVTFVEYEDLLY